MNSKKDLENKCKQLLKDLKKQNAYKSLISDENYNSIVVVMKYEFICETYFETKSYPLQTTYKPVLSRYEKYAKYDFLPNDDIKILFDNITFDKYYDLDRNYKLHCYVSTKTNKNLDTVLPTLTISIEYYKNDCVIF